MVICEESFRHKQQQSLNPKLDKAFEKQNYSKFYVYCWSWTSKTLKSSLLNTALQQYRWVGIYETGLCRIWGFNYEIG